MGSITGLTAAAMSAIRNAVVEGAAVVGDNLILTKHDGSTFNAGNVRGKSFQMVTADLANISGIAGSVIGDYFINTDTANHTILGVANVPPGGVVRATTATAGTLQTGSLRGPASVIPVVSALPGAPSNGDEIYYQNAAMKVDGIMWRLRYDSSAPGAYKWIAVPGGSSWGSMVDAAENTSASAIGDLTTVGPQITIPLAGDYMIEAWMDGYSSAADGVPFAVMKFGAAAPDTSADRVFVFRPGNVSQGQKGGFGGRRYRKNGLTAASVVKIQYLTGNGNGTLVSFANRSLYLTPIRVG